MSSCGYVEFSITDGTVVIDLLAANRGNKAGFGLQRYTPGRPQLKDGGVWQDSPLAVGRQLVFGIDGNTSDAITLICGGPDQEFIIRAYEDLDLLLKKAQAYWTTTWQQTPVYLRARAKGETATRYALIRYGKFDEYFDPYGQLFAGGGFEVTSDEFVLGIERGLWLDLPPGQGEDVPITHAANSGDPITATGDYDDDEGLVIGSYHNAGLTHVYQFTASGSVFSANRLDGLPPYTLLGATMAVGNILYLGADFPFFGVKFELSTLAGTATITWEVWDGAAWTSTASLQPFFTFQAAVPQTFRHTPSVWAKTTINGRNKYWLRARVAAVTVNTSPVQANRHVYATAQNYVEVAEDEVAGTADALLRFSNTLIGIGSAVSIYVGLRSYDRGPNFQSNINVGGGNPSGVSETNSGDTGITQTAADGLAPGGASVQATGQSNWGTMHTFHFAPPALSSFLGRFRLFARVVTGNGTSLSAIRYNARAFNTLSGGDSAVVAGEIKRLPTGSTQFYILVDLGLITLPLSESIMFTDEYAGFDIRIRSFIPGSETLTLYGIVLLPVDEWTTELASNITLPNTADTQAYVLDAIGYPKYPKRAFATEADRDITSPILAISSDIPIIHSNARQRYWFAPGGIGSTMRSVGIGVRMAKSQRNLSLRSAT
jgi:hypothetical protein